MTYSSSQQLTGSLSVFNPYKLTKHMEHNHSRAAAIIEIMDRLISETTTPIENARGALRREQPHQASHMLHALRCSIGNIGGARVTNIIEDLEVYLDCYINNKEQVSVLLDSLEREYLELLNQAECWVEQQRDRFSCIKTLKKDKEQAQINQLKSHLRNNNLKACDSFGELHQYFQSSLTPTVLTQLNNHIYDLQFDKALQCLDEAL